jgi:hypothetical protein
MSLDELAREFEDAHPDLAHMVEMVMLEQIDEMLGDSSVVDLFDEADVLSLDIRKRYADELRRRLESWVSA